jgi:nicotinate-nucleotide--dimethylbenzimidazole phosphoribosyltransferase
MTKASELKIEAVSNAELRNEIQLKLDMLTKPPGSLGVLEKLAMRYCLCKGKADACINRKSICVFAGDHGITAEGVAPYPKEVTVQMVLNMLAGGAAVTVMCKKAEIDYYIVDMGVDGIFDEHPLFINKKVDRGTKNFMQAAAMTEKECSTAVDAGIDVAQSLQCDIAAVGEMGIGNTSSASALCALLLGKEGSHAVGAGTGAAGSVLETKRRVVDAAVQFHRDQWDNTAEDALRRVGGFEIAGMTGYMLGCAARRIPVVIDGFIATTAALCAAKMQPAVLDYLFFGHVSDEQFHKNVLEEMGVSALLNLGMRLGEGTGAILAVQIIEQSLNCYHNMATFSSAGVSNRDS